MLLISDAKNVDNGIDPTNFLTVIFLLERSISFLEGQPPMRFDRSSEIRKKENIAKSSPKYLSSAVDINQ